jgi:hypothetical protein
MYAGFKGHQGLDNGAAGILDDFYVDATGISQVPEPGSLLLAGIAAVLMLLPPFRKKFRI